MPLQNRVTPFGEIVAVPQRGMFIGNRGIIHDPKTRTLLNKRWATRTWLVCTCDYKDIRRTVMGAGSWTELFFLDEATALSAGHRPCFLCRRERAGAFRAAWATAQSILPPSASQIDVALHRERLQNGHKRLHVLAAPISTLPDGAMIAADGAAYAVVGGEPFLWTHDGYRVALHPSFVDGLLTPPSTLAALKAGYRPVFHPSLKTIRTNGPAA
ncbi:hypothetical protein FHS82_004017 [Pseudochelatococcus lubricantis]|uniref:Hedgehog/Intein (Hint) domain-containing protein n=1 Tax=Pseudochelatococcus lubricantis TaxID=1538102 RepID=A0ABX0V745_9HYPH|nr:hypothetical protein [Pseudochelatococcus lubricantis]NIJ60150.1 hypothetical protein [Pseudochelatococcus lubricantis]